MNLPMNINSSHNEQGRYFVIKSLDEDNIHKVKFILILVYKI